MELHRGQTVCYRGRQCLIESVRVHGIAAPYARLSYLDTGQAVHNGELISHRLLRAVDARATDAQLAQGDISEAEERTEA